MGTLQSRLKFARKSLNLTQTDVARMVGIKQPSYSAIENKSYNNGSKYLPEIAQALNVDLYWLIHGVNHPNYKANIFDDDTYHFPVIDIIWDESNHQANLSKITSYNSISLSLVKKSCPNINDLIFIEAKNNAMTPFIKQGDLVGFNPIDTNIFDGEIYIIYFQHEFIIRKIFKEPDGAISLYAFNPNYPLKYLKSHHQLEDFKIIGRQCFRLG